MLLPNRYIFGEYLAEYQRYRPRWPVAFARWTLGCAPLSRNADGSWMGTAGGRAPIVACIGAGTGHDAATFKAMGSTVILVDPDPAFLAAARLALTPIRTGTAHFLKGTAERSGIDPRYHGPMDLIVAAQSIHAFRDDFAGAGAEQRTRRHWSDILVADGRPRVAIWTYNPDSRAAITSALHRVLSGCSPEYAASATPFIDTPHTISANVGPWIDATDTHASPLLDVGIVRLAEADLPGWMASYSFRPTSPKAMSVLCRHLKHQWFVEFADRGIVTVPYTGTIVQGRLRHA